MQKPQQKTPKGIKNGPRECLGLSHKQQFWFWHG